MKNYVDVHLIYLQIEKKTRGKVKYKINFSTCNAASAFYQIQNTQNQN